MQVNELMTRDVRTASPEQSLQQVAQLMAELDVGVLPVGENDRLVGMITDRDIAIRGVAQGKSASTQAGEFVREEIDRIRHGEHGARSTKQAIAIGLSEARRAGVDALSFGCTKNGDCWNAKNSARLRLANSSFDSPGLGVDNAGLTRSLR